MEYAERPLALEQLRPRFSWRIPSQGSRRGEQQLAYTIAVVPSPSTLDAAMAAVSPVSSNRSTLVRPEGVRLQRGRLYWARVSVDTNQRRGLTAELLLGTAPSAADYAQAKFIGMASASNTSCPWLRKDVASPPTGWTNTGSRQSGRAIAYVASVGYHELYVNGAKVSADVLSPSISDLAKRALVRPYDITHHLQPGKPFTLGLWLGPGWSQFGSHTRLQASNIFNTTKAPLALATVRFYGGQGMGLLGSVHTDASWKAHLSPIQ